MLPLLPLFLVVLFVLFLLVAYIQINDRHIKAIPDRVNALSPHRWTPEYVKKQAARYAKEAPTKCIRDQLPPKTGRRYIIIGGSGFLGGWIVNQLLERGENAQHIRIVDLHPPLRKDLLTGLALQIQFISADVCSPSSIQAALSAPWAAGVPLDTEITIFHTAANIRFYERNPDLLPFSARVNTEGTKNVIEAAKLIGATVLLYTSSASVAIRRTQFFLWPWQKEPKHFVQVINDSEPKDNPVLPRKHEEYFSNYAVSKIAAEKHIRGADKSPTGLGTENVLRTGIIRPGNAVYGPRGDMLCGAYLVRQSNPSWIHNSVQSFVYVENCALAHLLYEARLIESSLTSSPKTTPKSSRNPDLGGQFFNIVDPGPTPAYGDVYTQLETLTKGETNFPVMSATGLLMLAYAIEAYYLLRFRVLGTTTGNSSWNALSEESEKKGKANGNGKLNGHATTNGKTNGNGKSNGHSTLAANGNGNGASAPKPKPATSPKTTILTRLLSYLLPPLPSDLVNLQPSLFFLTSVHALFDDSRARLPPSQGGLGYEGVWNTFEGVCKTTEEHYNLNKSEGQGPIFVVGSGDDTKKSKF